MTEAEAIPFHPAHLRGERLLVLAPHPDDEAIGCGGLVAQHLREGRQVRVVVATDGAAQGEGALREEESRRGLATLVAQCGAAALGGEIALHHDAGEGAGATPSGRLSVHFLRFGDRQLVADDALAAQLREHLQSFRPDLVLAPSPIEIHPDHAALARALCDLIQRDDALFADLAIARVAFYEVGQPLRPNAIVDITDVADAKFAAIAEHASQNGVRDYVALARGLNAYRAMTMPAHAKFAEAYFVVGLAEMRVLATSELQRSMGDARGVIASTRENLPVSVIVRTKDRPALLREAVASIRGSGYPAEIVVVNDGGARPELDGVTLVNHESSRGRSEAMNAGVQAAKSAYVAFLDDDDLYYPEHLDTLARAASGSKHVAWYTDAVSAFVHTSESGALAAGKRLRLFGGDFDRDRLLLDNYIPLPTLMVRRDDFLAAGGFDPAFDLFEDWDFLIRLAQRGDFVHVPRITCEIRHVEGGGSITMAAPEGSSRFREAKKQVWRKHAALLDHDAIANAFERQKRETQRLFSDAVELRGARHNASVDLARLEREKSELVAQIGTLHEEMNAALMRIRELETIEFVVRDLQIENEKKAVQLAFTSSRLEEIERANDEAQTTVKALYAEVHRLQGLLDAIYGSRTWKLHSMMERMRGQR